MRSAWSSPRLAFVGLASVFVALTLYTTITNQPGRYVPDARLEQVVAPAENLARHAYLWDDSRSPGTPTSALFFSPATAAFGSVASALGAPPWLIERLTHALYLSLAAIGVILLMRAFHPRIGLEHAVAAFVYTFSPFTSQFLLPSSLFLYYCLAPWFALFALRGVRDGDPWRWAAAFALAIAASGAINSAALAFALVPAALTALYFALIERRDIGRLWRWTWRTVVLSALTCSAAIVVLALSGPEVSADLHKTELPETVGRTSSWSETWRGLGFWLSYYADSSGLRSIPTAYFTQPLVILTTFLAPLGALIALALVRWRHRLLFAAMLLVSLVFMVGIHEVEGPAPLPRLFSFAFDHSDLALGFRSTYKAGPGLMLAIAALLGVGVVAAVEAAARRTPGGRGQRPGRTRLRLMLGVAVPTFVAVGVVIASFPFWTDRLYPDTNGFRSIPRYWDRTFSYLGEQQQPSRLLVLPGAEEDRYRWGHVHDDLFDGLSPATPLINRELRAGTAESADLVEAIDEYVSSPSYVKGTLAPILARLGVRWVLLQNDLDWQRMYVPRPSTYDALRADPGLRLAATFGHRGANTASPGDRAAGPLGERALPPVQVYEVRGAPSPRPRLVSGPPLLVAGGGDSWPSLASAGLLGGPPVAYTGAADDQVLRQMVASGSQVVVTDGNRRRAFQTATAGRPSPSATLAVGGPQGRRPYELFGNSESQSTATYPDADWISASRYGFPLGGHEAASRPANAFDGVERTAWTVRGPLGPDGESVTAKLRKPTTVTEVSVLPSGDGPWRVTAVDVILHSEDGRETQKRVRFGAVPGRARAQVNATGVTEIELRIAKVAGPGPVGLAGVGIAEVGVTTPSGPLDLREFVRTPEDLADRAARDGRLHAELAARPPRYELRRVTGSGLEDEETELRREITTFGDHRYQLSATARIDNRSADSAIDGLLGKKVGAAGTSRLDGHLDRRGGLAVDDDLSTGWEPYPRRGERLDLHFPPTQVRTVEVLTVSGPIGGVARSRVTDVDVSVGNGAPVHSALPRSPRCVPSGSSPGSCLERQVVHVAPTDTDHLSVTLAGIQQLVGPFGRQPPKVVEVRINGRDWSAVANQAAPGTCAPLFAVDGQPIPVRLPPDANGLLAGRPFELKACGPVQLGPGRHRIETLPGLSGAVLTASLVPLGENLPTAPTSSPGGQVQLVDRSPTQLHLRVNAPKGALLEGGMPFHPGWVAQGGNLRRTPVPLDTFAAWRVEAPTAGPVTLRFNPQRIYELALALSLATAAWCLWRVTHRRGNA